MEATHTKGTPRRTHWKTTKPNLTAFWPMGAIIGKENHPQKGKAPLGQRDPKSGEPGANKRSLPGGSKALSPPKKTPGGPTKWLGAGMGKRAQTGNREGSTRGETPPQNTGGAPKTIDLRAPRPPGK